MSRDPTEEPLMTARDRLSDYHMDEQDCWRHLRDHATKVGRLAFVWDGVPTILPMNYRVDGTSLVFRTHAGPTLAAVAHGQMLAFEADEVDVAWQAGWSVLAQGRAEKVTDRDQIRRLERLGLRPWASGDHEDWVMLTPTRISGRQIV